MFHGSGPNRLQTFLLSSLKPSTIQKYVACLEDLNNELAAHNVKWSNMSEEDQDNFIAEWLIDGFESGANKTVYGWTLSAVQKIFPRLRLKTSWRVLDIWGQRQPVKQAPAATPEFLHAMMAMALFLNRPQMACVMVFCYAGSLRVREALCLKYRDVVVQCDSIILCLGQTKRGLEQKVVLRNSSVVRFTMEYLRRNPGSPDDDLFEVTYSSILRWVKRLSWLLGGDDMVVSARAFRRSGASELSRLGMPLRDILLYGRWSSESAAREYIRQGEVAVRRSRQAQCPQVRFCVGQWALALVFFWLFVDLLKQQADVIIPTHHLTQERFDKCEKSIFLFLDTFQSVGRLGSACALAL